MFSDVDCVFADKSNQDTLALDVLISPRRSDHGTAEVLKSPPADDVVHDAISAGIWAKDGV